MAAYYIDGDNNPGARTQGIEYLPDKDMATFFYAKGNTYYALEKNRKEWALYRQLKRLLHDQFLREAEREAEEKSKFRKIIDKITACW